MNDNDKPIQDLFPNFTHLTGAQFLYDPVTNIAYVCILKNAHTWASRLFTDNLGCELISVPPKDAKVVVILRHPISRWISGFAQFMTEFNEDYLHLLDDPYFRQLMFTAVRWDDHTSRQVDAIATVKAQNCLFFKCNGDLERNLTHFVGSVRGINIGQVINNDMYNRANDGSIRPVVYGKLQQLIASNASYKKKLLEYYDIDMQLIAHINEHNLWYSPNTNT